MHLQDILLCEAMFPDRGALFKEPKREELNCHKPSWKNAQLYLIFLAPDFDSFLSQQNFECPHAAFKSFERGPADSNGVLLHSLDVLAIWVGFEAMIVPLL